MQSQKNIIRLLYYMEGVREGDETNAPWIMKFRIEFVDDDNNLLEEYLNPSASALLQWQCSSKNLQIVVKFGFEWKEIQLSYLTAEWFYQKIIES